MGNNIYEARQLYYQFNEGVNISSIKNPNLEIEFLKTLMPWFFPFGVLMGLIINFQSLLRVVKPEEIIMLKFGIIALAILTLISLFNQYYKLYFSDNLIVFKNKLGKKISININEEYQMYVEHKIVRNTEHTRSYYILHIKQGKNKIDLDICMVGAKKIRLFLENIS